MNEPDVDVVQRRLAQVLEQERREAMGYVVLTVLLTPAFVVVAALIVSGIAGYIWLKDGTAFDLDPVTFYTTVNVFLAYVIASVPFSGGREARQMQFDRTWIAGTATFVVLLVATYGTPLVERHPVPLALAYGVGGFAILGCMGHSFYADRSAEVPERDPDPLTPLLAVSGFIVAAYGELTRSSWLWQAPEDDEVRIGAWVLCKLASEMSGPCWDEPGHRRIVGLLRRLELVQEADDRLVLTAKGQDFIRAATLGSMTGHKA